jgi:hypothetical protein
MDNFSHVVCGQIEAIDDVANADQAVVLLRGEVDQRPWLTLRVSPIHLNRSNQREQMSIFSVSSVISCPISGIPGIQRFALFFNQTHA